MPNTDRTLLKWAKLAGEHHHEDHAHVGDPPNRGSDAAGRALAGRLDQETHGQRDEHQHDQRPRDLYRVDRDSLEEERQGEGQGADGDDDQQHHQAHREGQIGLGELRELDRERRPRRQPAQQQADPQRLVETDRSARARRDPGARTKFAARDSTTSRAFLSGARIWPTVRLRPTPSVLDTTKTTTATLEPRISRSLSAIVAAFVTSFAQWPVGQRRAAALDIANSQRRAHSTVTGDVWVPLACCGTSRRPCSACHHGSRGTSSGGCWNVIHGRRGRARGCEGCRCRRTGW